MTDKVKMEPKIHTFKGMTTIETRRLVPVSKIKPQEGKNTARAEGLIDETITLFQRLILNGDYQPHHYEPPAVIEKKNGEYEYSLVVGEHRFQSHIGTDQEFMWVQVVEFENDEILDLFQSQENIPNEKYVQTPRKAKDIESTATRILKRKGYDEKNPPSEKLVTSTLGKLNIRGHEKLDKNKIKKSILKNFGMTESAQTYTLPAAEHWIERNNLAENYDAIIIQASYVKENAEEQDLDGRVYKKIIDIKLQDPAARCLIVAGFHQLEPKKIRTVRPKKIKRLLEFYPEQICAMADAIRNPHYTNPEIVFLPQTPEDFKNESN